MGNRKSEEKCPIEKAERIFMFCTDIVKGPRLSPGPHGRERLILPQ